LYFLTLTVIDWIDIFTKPIYKHIIIDSLCYCQKNKGLELYAWCLMSNHLHMIAGVKEGFSLSAALRDFKKFTNKQILKEIREGPESRKVWLLHKFAFAAAHNKKIKNYTFWQEGNEPKEIHTNEFLSQKLEYIHNNPIKAEIVANPEDYLYSSALNYAGDLGLIEVVLVD